MLVIQITEKAQCIPSFIFVGNRAFLWPTLYNSLFVILIHPSHPFFFSLRTAKWKASLEAPSKYIQGI